MAYDKVFFDESGEEYPYSESFDTDTYHYRISVIWDDRDAELSVINQGCHLVFDDDGSLLDFNTAPDLLFPGAKNLSPKELAQLLGYLANNIDSATLYSQDQMQAAYQRFLKTTSN